MKDVAELESLLAEQPVNPMRPEQRKQYDAELDRLGTIANAPPYVSADRGAAATQYRRVKQMVDTQRPKPIGDPVRASRIHALKDQIIRDVIQPAMLPQAVMRRNPAGAVDAFRKRENSRPVKRAILAVKRALFALDPETDDSDHANMEKYRPSGLNPDGTSTFMAEAQLPGVFAMTPRARENWPLGEPQVDTPLAQARRQEAPTKPKKVYSEAEKAVMRDRLAKGRATSKANREAAAAAR